MGDRGFFWGGEEQKGNGERWGEKFISVPVTTNGAFIFAEKALLTAPVEGLGLGVSPPPSSPLLPGPLKNFGAV